MKCKIYGLRWSVLLFLALCYTYFAFLHSSIHFSVQDLGFWCPEGLPKGKEKVRFSFDVLAQGNCLCSLTKCSSLFVSSWQCGVFFFGAALKLSAGSGGGGGGKQEKQSLAFEKINEKHTLDCTPPGTWGWAPTDGTALPSEEVRKCCSLPALASHIAIKNC